MGLIWHLIASPRHCANVRSCYCATAIPPPRHCVNLATLLMQNLVFFFVALPRHFTVTPSVAHSMLIVGFKWYTCNSRFQSTNDKWPTTPLEFFFLSFFLFLLLSFFLSFFCFFLSLFVCLFVCLFVRTGKKLPLINQVTDRRTIEPTDWHAVLYTDADSCEDASKKELVSSYPG